MSVFEEDTSIEERVLEVIKSNEEYKEILEEIVAFEKQNPNMHDRYEDFSNYKDTAWALKDLPSNINPGKLGHLKKKGIISSVMSTNNTSIDNLWALTDREQVEEALRIKDEGDVKTVEEPDTVLDEIPDDIFDTIVGHEDVKQLFVGSIEAAKPVHILLVGPPASGKTVFLDEIKRLKGSEYLVGSSTTGPGLLDELFEKRPHNILIDEFDKIEKKDYGNLLSLQEDGTVKETKGNEKRREMKLEHATVYAAANRLDNIPDENISRFLGDPAIKLDKYEDEEFREVTVNILTMREDVDKNMATKIADIIVDETDIRDFRECRRIARLSSDSEEVRKYINIVQNYSSDSLL